MIVGVVFLGDLVGRLVILNPEGDIPGLPIFPTVHRVSFVCCVYPRRSWGEVCPMGDGSATVPIASGITFPTTAVVVFCCEVIVEVAVEVHGLPCPSRQISKGGTVRSTAEALIVVHVVCVHGSIIRGQGGDQFTT